MKTSILIAALAIVSTFANAQQKTPAQRQGLKEEKKFERTVRKSEKVKPPKLDKSEVVAQPTLPVSKKDKTRDVQMNMDKVGNDGQTTRPKPQTTK